MSRSLQVLLAGNPNVGKSKRCSDRLTGRKQHVGNWPGQTVELATGQYTYKGRQYELRRTYRAPIPWTPVPPEEQVARTILEQGEFDCLVVVCDATCLAAKSWTLTYQPPGAYPKRGGAGQPDG